MVPHWRGMFIAPSFTIKGGASPHLCHNLCVLIKPHRARSFGVFFWVSLTGFVLGLLSLWRSLLVFLLVLEAPSYGIVLSSCWSSCVYGEYLCLEETLVFMVKTSLLRKSLCLWWRPLSWGSSCVCDTISLVEVLVFVEKTSLLRYLLCSLCWPLSWGDSCVDLVEDLLCVEILVCLVVSTFLVEPYLV